METTIATTQASSPSNFTALQQKVEQLLKLKTISLNDIEHMSNLEREYLAETCSRKLSGLKGAERDDFLDKIAAIVPVHTRSQTWEYNHGVISDTISKLMQQYGSMPSQYLIARECGLSRPTVAKHLATYKMQPEFAAHMEQYKFMAPKLLANVYKSALNGDTRAARLYLETVGAVNKHQINTVVNKQNNYIQINNTILSQENLKRLSAEQLDQIEKMIIGIG